PGHADGLKGPVAQHEPVLDIDRAQVQAHDQAVAVNSKALAEDGAGKVHRGKLPADQRKAVNDAVDGGGVGPDVAVVVNAERVGSGRQGKINGAEPPCGEQESMLPQGIVVQPYDLPQVVNAPSGGSGRSGKIQSPERTSAQHEAVQNTCGVVVLAD